MHIEIIKKKIAEQSDRFNEIKEGDYSAVCYHAARDKKYGMYDKNYHNRLNLVYYILFHHIDCELIIKRLFEEELKDRETNGFQGIGSAFEVLSFLLMKYNNTKTYDALFKRAEKANFDCACGYNPKIKINADLNTYSIEECITIAIEIGAQDCAKQLIDIWKSGITEWDEKYYRQLIFYNKDISREIENEQALTALLDIRIKQGDSIRLISALKDLMHYYIQFEQNEQAYECFVKISESNDLAAVYEINLFNFILEDCMELICQYDEKAQILWVWAKPFIERKMVNMYGNLYVKCIKAAETINDPFAGELSRQYNMWKNSMKI